MAKTTAQQQAAYPARRSHAGNDGNGQRRLALWLGTAAALALARLAKRYCVTKREMMERLLNAADGDVLDTLELDSPEWEAYFRVTQ